ncbi:MAG: HAMP domain-containing histidine kinase [Oscillospiraceae bacterium]|jgi:signal transduction histidine kinase|nr:HAMP domain-containing histidine kinase [Oscillospiraceae bacterium]
MSEAELQERINQELSGFMSNVDFRLRDKLSVLLPALDLLEKRISPNADDGVIRYLGEIRKSAYGILRIAGNMADYAKYIRNYRESEPARTNLSEMMTSLLRETARLARYKQILFTFECAETPFYAVVDRNQIELLLYHLLSNAVLHGEGDITASLKRFDGSVVITVSNKRGAIPENTLATLYTGYREYAGAEGGKPGLGLPIALAIACQNGGTLAVSSDEKSGTSVVVSLPDLRDETFELESPFLDEYGGANQKILIAMSDFPGCNEAYLKEPRGGNAACTTSMP